MGAIQDPAGMQRFGFPVGGEPSIAIDFVDTVYRDTPTTTVDLLAEPGTAWWHLESGRLPDSGRPNTADIIRLRNALRAAFEMTIEGIVPDDTILEELNHFVELVPTSPRLSNADGVLEVETRWHVQPGGDANLSTIARDGMALLLDTERVGRLRSCANPDCIMIFVAENTKRIWCSSTGCGNRARAARHYHRLRTARPAAQADDD
jgi:predicted RNA-binding Zn ribbon-like protein